MSTVRILLLCTANQCRSPMAEVILTDIAARRGLDVTTRSAGFSDEGVEATDSACRVVAKLGLDLRAHRSRRCSPAHLDSADLVLTMERSHLFHIAEMSPAAIARSFTLVEFARLVAETPRSGEFRAWVAAVHERRPSTRILHVGRGDDVADPTGRSLRQHRRTAGYIADVLNGIADAAWPIPGQNYRLIPLPESS